MANEALERARRRLELYYKAEEAILTGQEYTIGSKKLRRADLSDVQAMISKLEKDVKALDSGGKNRAVRAVPLDI
nr:MAG TPA: head to tail adaptor [Caudoviricetes sp.]